MFGHPSTVGSTLITSPASCRLQAQVKPVLSGTLGRNNASISSSTRTKFQAVYLSDREELMHGGRTLSCVDHSLAVVSGVPVGRISLTSDSRHEEVNFSARARNVCFKGAKSGKRNKRQGGVGGRETWQLSRGSTHWPMVIQGQRLSPHRPFSTQCMLTGSKRFEERSGRMPLA